MEKQPSYILKLSLQQMTLRRIAIALYCEPHILASIAQFRFHPDKDCRNIWDASNDLLLNSRRYRNRPVPPTSDYNNIEWRRIVEDKMSKLPLPKSLMRQMKPILKAVGSELHTWKSIHQEYLSSSSEEFNANVLERLCWTSAASVDYLQTAKQLVCYDLLDNVQRFKLACLYCLEDHIPTLWEDLPDESKRSLYNEELSSEFKTVDLHLFLPCILQKLSTIDSVHASNSFEKAALCGNKALAEYCFLKLTKEERKDSLVRTAKNVMICRVIVCNENDFRRKKLSEVACFLLSLMSPEEQIRIFKYWPCYVLSCFLDWPWQDLFMDIADVFWTFLPQSTYSNLVFCIDENIKNSGFYFPDFFQNLFLRSPMEFRKSFVNAEIRHEYFLRYFFICEDTETIKVLFRNIDAANRKRLVFSKHGLDLIYLWHFKWHLVEEFLCAAMLSKEEKDRLKMLFIKFVNRHYRKYRHSLNWLKEEHRMFFEFVEETASSAENKRSLEEETLTKTKKLCCEIKDISTV